MTNYLHHFILNRPSCKVLETENNIKLDIAKYHIALVRNNYLSLS